MLSIESANAFLYSWPVHIINRKINYMNNLHNNPAILNLTDKLKDLANTS